MTKMPQNLPFARRPIGGKAGCCNGAARRKNIPRAERRLSSRVIEAKCPVSAANYFQSSEAVE